MGRHSKPNRAHRAKCAICGKTFWSRHSMGKYCSPEHQREGERISWRKYGEKNRERRRQNYREHYKKNRDKIIARIIQYRKRFPERERGRWTVHNALASGKLKKQSCERCGAATATAHHPDYSKPAKIVWLCYTCHSWEHAPQRRRSPLLKCPSCRKPTIRTLRCRKCERRVCTGCITYTSKVARTYLCRKCDPT